MVEIVSRIKTAEEQAEEIKKSARQQVRVLAEEAVADGKKLVESQRDEASKKAAEMITGAQAQAETYLSERSAVSLAECKQLGEGAQANMEKAARMIVERIVERL